MRPSIHRLGHVPLLSGHVHFLRPSIRDRNLIHSLSRFFFLVIEMSQEHYVPGYVTVHASSDEVSYCFVQVVRVLCGNQIDWITYLCNFKLDRFRILVNFCHYWSNLHILFLMGDVTKIFGLFPKP